MVRKLLVAGAVLASVLPATSTSAGERADSTPRSTLSPLVKNQKIAFGAIGAWNKASKRYLAFIKAEPKAAAATVARVNCVLGESSLSGPQIGSLPESYGKGMLASFANYTQFNINRQTPLRSGRFSARAIRGILTGRARSLTRLNPDATGRRIIRGVEAQAARITQIRNLPRSNFCKTLVDWRLGGWNNDFLFQAIEPQRKRYTGLLYGKVGKRVLSAVSAMQSVPGVPDTDILNFKQIWLTQQAFSYLSQN